MKKNIFKSVGVVLLAFVGSALLSVITDFVLESIGILPDPKNGLFETWAIIIVLIYRGAYTILAGFVVGKLAPNKPMLHAIILGVIGTVITLLAISNPEFAQKSKLWFGYTLAAISIPCLWLGVKIQQSWIKESMQAA